MTWRMEMGANLTSDGCRFDVWSTNATDVAVELVQGDRISTHQMEALGDDHFRVEIAGVRAGDRYRFRLDGADGLPDPCSRFQPEGVHGPSEVIDPSTFKWSDENWPGISAANLAIYEVHVGTMTSEGNYAGLEGELEAIRDLGVTAVEVMPVAQTPGTRNWGYDGVDLFAPNHVYGRPDDLRRLVDAAHRVGLGVILDVVYNHLGPEGAYLSAYSDAYFSETHQTSWGAGLNWDGPHSHWVRQFAIGNACYWISEFHVDGLRLDATHAILDDSQKHLVQELTEAARVAAGDREIVVIAEDERHDVTRVRPTTLGGEGLDGVWADDFHHEVRVLLTNAHESYYALYDGTTEDIAHAIQNGFGLEQPEVEAQPDASDAASAFVFCIQNHDQIGNRPLGTRLHHEISEARYRVASALLLFAPETPLLFMGQEFAASTPFLYFTDHPPGLGQLVTEGRRKEFAGFRAFDDPRLRDTIPDPQAESTFLASKLDLSERETNADVLELHRVLLRLRREDPVLMVQDFQQTNAFAPSAEIVAVHRWNAGEHRLLVANFGHRTETPSSWLEAVEGGPVEGWEMVLSTSEERFGGSGQQPNIDSAARSLTMPARTAAVFRF